ncbi:MAG: phosphatase domain-containing protein [Gemmatimonadota bacterium]
MSGVRRALHALLAEAEARIDGFRGAVRRAGGRASELDIHLYGGHGNERRTVLRGRVLEARPLRPAGPDDSALRNLARAIARLDSTEVGGARIRLVSGGASAEVESDDEGYFEATLTTPTGSGLWRRVEASVLAAPAPFRAGARASGQYQVPAPGVAAGIISDLDDTVLRTEATSLLRMARHTFFGNAHTRQAFPGVGALYRGLRGDAESLSRPFFYVSSSPWNLFDLLVRFLELNHIPRGTLLLKDYGLTSDHLIAADHTKHKLAHVLAILDAHPGLRFVLMGDSGQHDADVYAAAVRERPGRVRAVCIRRVARQRDGLDRSLADIAAGGAAAVAGADTLALARGLAEAELISAGVVEAVEREMKRDLDDIGPSS